MLVRVLMLVISSLLLMGPREVVSVSMSIDIEPSTIFRGTESEGEKGAQINITCVIFEVAADQVVQLVFLQKKLNNGAYVELVTFDDDTGEITIKDNMPGINASPRATADGYVLNVMMLSSCEDAGTYGCTANVHNAFPGRSDDKDLCEVNPDKVILTAEPDGVTEWTEGQTLNLTCSAAVGTHSDASDPTLFWQSRKNGEDQWTDYQNVREIKNFTTKLECFDRWWATLTKVLTAHDSGLEIRCYLIRNHSHFFRNAPVYLVGTVNEIKTTKPSSPYTVEVKTTKPSSPYTVEVETNTKSTYTTEGSSGSSTSNTSWNGAFVGLGVALFFGLAVIILLVAVLRRRRRSQARSTGITDTNAYRFDKKDESIVMTSSAKSSMAGNSASVLESSVAVGASTVESSIADSSSELESSVADSSSKLESFVADSPQMAQTVGSSK